MAEGGALDQEQPGAQSSAGDRLMTYEARFSILVSNVDKAVDEYLAAVGEAGGHLSRRQDGTVTCRVPAARFFALTERLRGFGRVLEEQIDAQDITREYHDLELRIQTAENSLARLVAILERADDVENILKIEQEMRRLTEEIERMKGQLRYYADNVAFSTIRVQFTSNAPDQKPIELRTRSPFRWIELLGVEQVLRRG